MIIEGDTQRDWREGEPRTSRLVFIGRNLDRAELEPPSPRARRDGASLRERPHG